MSNPPARRERFWRRPNARWSRPYCAERAGLAVVYLGNRFSPEQPDCLWHDDAPDLDRPEFLRRRVPLEPGDRLTVLDDPLFDLAVGVPLARVRHERSEVHGYVTLETLLGETQTDGLQLWVAADAPALRAVVEVDLPGEVLYSTVRLAAEKIDAAQGFLGRIAGPRDDGAGKPVHPLQAGSEAHRLALWALASERSRDERAHATALLERLFERYFVPAALPVGSGCAWPYQFEFDMPWGTRLAPPWYSGYANSAIASAAACLFRLSGRSEHRSVAEKAFAFLRTPMESGGALYEIDGFPFIAEYVYRSPPVPNYRVCDGEVMALPYLYDCAVLLADAAMLDFVARLGAGLAAMLRMMCSEDGLPRFGMDGQAMNPDYMWQLWVAVQLIANITKDRAFLDHARRWREAIPQHAIADGLPV